MPLPFEFRPGRRPPHPNDTHPRLYVDKFFTGAVIPQAVSYGEGVTYPMDLNDSIGDCAPAGEDHLQMSWCAASGKPVASWGDAGVLSMYERQGGYVPDNPSTDQGCILQECLADWQKNGDPKGNKIYAYGALRDWRRFNRLTALHYFGPLYVGVSLPQSAMEQFPGPWTLVQGSPIVGGHCILQIAEDRGSNEVRNVSWGKVVHTSRAWVAEYTEEVWVAIDDYFLSQMGANPDGIDKAAMQAELTRLTGAALIP